MAGFTKLCRPSLLHKALFRRVALLKRHFFTKNDTLLLYANNGPMEALRIVWINADAAFFAVLSD